MSEKALVRTEPVQPARNGQRAIAPLQINMGSLDLMQLGKVFVEAGCFPDLRSQALAVVKILYGQELGISPVQSVTGIHIIKGKAVPSAGVIATVIKRSGIYDYRVRQWDNDGCNLEFYEHGESLGLSSFDRKDATTAQLLTGPESGNWTKYFRNMAFARALTNGARIYTPAIFGGPIYSAEEMGTAVDGETGEPIRVTEHGEVIDVSSRVTGALETGKSFSGSMGLNEPAPAATGNPQGSYFALLKSHAGDLSGDDDADLRRSYAAALIGAPEPCEQKHWEAHDYRKALDGLERHVAACQHGGDATKCGLLKKAMKILVAAAPAPAEYLASDDPELFGAVTPEPVGNAYGQGA